MKKGLAVVFSLLFAFGVNAEVKTWIGGTDNFWETEGNWNPAGVPVSGDTVLFNTDATVDVNSVSGSVIQITANTSVGFSMPSDVRNVFNGRVTGDSSARFSFVSGETVVPKEALSSFYGTFEVGSSAKVILSETIDSCTLSLQDGASIKFANASLIGNTQTAEEALPDFLSGKWYLDGKKTIAESSQFPRIEENGTIVFIDDIGEKHIAILTNQAVTLTTPWEVSFVFHEYAIKKYSNEHRAEGFSFFIQPNMNDATYKDRTSAISSDAEGFYIRTYSDTRGLQWIKNGSADSVNRFNEYNNGLNDITVLGEPIDVKVSYDGKGLMTVELRQDGKEFRASREVYVSADNMHKRQYITMSASSGNWGTGESDGKPASCHSVSNFSGKVFRTVYAETGLTQKPEFDISENNWQINDKMSLVDGKLITSKEKSAFSSAYCKTPLKASQAWRLTFTQEYLSHNDTGGEGWTFSMQTNSPVAEYQSHDKGRVNFGAEKHSYGFAFYYWSGSLGWLKDRVVSKFSPPSWLKLKGSEGKNKPIYTEVVYDGRGYIRISLTQGNNTHVMEKDFGDIFSKNDDIYIGFTAVASSWGTYVEHAMYDLKLECFNQTTVTSKSPVGIEEGANASLAVGAVADSAGLSVVFSSVVLEANSTLNVEKCYEEQTMYRIRFDEVKFPAAGAGTISSLNGVVELSELVFSGEKPYENNLIGKFAVSDSLDVVIPASWLNLAMPLVLADVSQIEWDGGIVPDVQVFDEAGNLINVKIKSSVSGGTLRLYKAGCVLIIR